MEYFLRLVVAILIIGGLAACETGQRPNEVQLTPAEVKSTFIGTPWEGPGGVFLFRENGTYTYQNFKVSYPRGTWPYVIEKDGTLNGGTTSYTFYKDGDEYRYYHSYSE